MARNPRYDILFEPLAIGPGSCPSGGARPPWAAAGRLGPVEGAWGREGTLEVGPAAVGGPRLTGARRRRRFTTLGSRCSWRAPAGPAADPTTDPPELGDADVQFPESGDAMLMIDEEDGVGCATYLGNVGGDEDPVVLTSLTGSSGDDSFTILFDTDGRPTEIAADSLRLTFEYNTDGTFNCRLFDGDQVVYEVRQISQSDAAAAKSACARGARVNREDIERCVGTTSRAFAEAGLNQASDSAVDALGGFDDIDLSGPDRDGKQPFLSGEEITTSLAAIEQVVDRYDRDDFRILLAGEPILIEEVQQSLQERF